MRKPRLMTPGPAPVPEDVLLELAIPGGYGPRVAESAIGLITNMSSSAPYEELRLKAK